jgi:DNA repair ATPase RecN
VKREQEFRLRRVRLLMLKTQDIREATVLKLQKWIDRAEQASEESEDLEVKQQWLKLAGFLTQVLNSLLKTYDQVRLDEDLQEAEKIISEVEKMRAEYEEKLREVEAKEQELQMWEQRLRNWETMLSQKSREA